MMSYFTRTGLIPAITSSSAKEDSHRQKVADPHLNMIIVSAPFTFRPFLQDRSYIHPYSSVCSIMCNHPIADDTMKKYINETKSTLRKGQAAKRVIQLNYLNDGYNTGTHDDIFVPEILFRRYTQTDSRPPTPTITTPLVVAKQTSTLHTARRCITPDNLHSSNAPDKTRLVLDLRKCLSQSSLAVEGKYVDVSKEDTIVCNSIIPTGAVKISVSTRSRRKKPGLLSSEITKHRYFSRKTLKKESRNDILFQKNTPYVLAAEAKLKNESNKKKKKHQKKPDKRKSKKTRKRNLHPETDEGFSENFETEMALNAENESKTNGNDDEAGDRDENNRSERSSTNSNEFNINNEYIRALLKDIDLEAFENDFSGDEKLSRFLKHNNLIAGYDHCVDLNALHEEYELNTFIERRDQRAPSLMVNPLNTQQEPPSSPSELLRIISRRNARFELPLDRTDLEGMQPLEYLKRHVHVSNSCRTVYNRIFHVYASIVKNHQEPPNSESDSFITTTKSLNDALLSCMGKKFQTEEQTNLCRLLCVNPNDDHLQIDVRTWNGICALCERIYGDRLISKRSSEVEDLCHEIETADFKFLDKKLANLSISAELKEILFLIRDS